MKTQLITREGYNKLRAEHDHLWNEKRPEITRIVSWAASLGDRSENADYTYNKRLLRGVIHNFQLGQALTQIAHAAGGESLFWCLGRGGKRARGSEALSHCWPG